MSYLLFTGVLLILSLAMTMDFSWNNVLTNVRNQLVFAGRNKEYGAYVLRRDYVKQLMMAVAGSVILVGLAISTPMIAAAFKGEEKVEDAVKIVDVNLELFEEEKKEEPPPPPVEPPPPPKIETVQFTALEAVDEPVEEPPPTQEILEETTAATTTEEGEKGEEPPPVVVEEEVMLFAAVEEKPEFPGGEKKFYEYLGKNMNYPEMDKEAGNSGRVFVEFLIDKDGSIAEVKVLRGVSPGLDKEAARVIKAMPKWNPGKQNGRPVKVRYVIPVNFTLR